MRSIISRLMSMFNGGRSSRRTSTTSRRGGLLSRLFSAFTGGRRRY